jgi:hypothetical protein
MGTRLKHINEKKVNSIFWHTKEIASACALAAAAAAVMLLPLRWQQRHRR